VARPGPPRAARDARHGREGQAGYKKDVDQRRIRENLKLTVDQRVRKVQSPCASSKKFDDRARKQGD